MLLAMLMWPLVAGKYPNFPFHQTNLEVWLLPEKPCSTMLCFCEMICINTNAIMKNQACDWALPKKSLTEKSKSPIR